MKKFFLMAMMALTAVTFVACGDDEENEGGKGGGDTTSSAALLADLADNEFTCGEFVKVKLNVNAGQNENGIYPDASYQGPSSDPTGAQGGGVYLGFISDMSKDVLNSISGKTINLADLSKNPKIADGMYYLALTLMDKPNNGVRASFQHLNPEENESSYEMLDSEKGVNYSWRENKKTIFKEGEIKYTYGNDGLRIAAHGTVENGIAFAVRYYIPLSQITSWN